jgi:hypothetical protein
MDKITGTQQRLSQVLIVLIAVTLFLGFPLPPTAAAYAADGDEPTESAEPATSDGAIDTAPTAPATLKDATLKSLKKSTGKLMPAFKNTKTSYTLIIAKTKASVKITPKATSTKSKIAIKNGGKYKNVKSTTVKFNRKGQTKTISIRVTAEDKVTVRTYKIRVSREM